MAEALQLETGEKWPSQPLPSKVRVRSPSWVSLLEQLEKWAAVSLHIWTPRFQDCPPNRHQNPQMPKALI